MNNEFKIEDLKVVNKVAGLLVIEYNKQGFSTEPARGTAYLREKMANRVEGSPMSFMMGNNIYSESFTVEIVEGAGTTDEQVKVAVIKQLGVTIK